MLRHERDILAKATAWFMSIGVEYWLFSLWPVSVKRQGCSTLIRFLCMPGCDPG